MSIVLLQTKMGRVEKDIPSTVQSKWEEERCNKEEISGQGISKECWSNRRLASLLNKAEITVDYNEVSFQQSTINQFNPLGYHSLVFGDQYLTEHY